MQQLIRPGSILLPRKLRLSHQSNYNGRSK